MALTWRGSTVTPLIQPQPVPSGNNVVFAVVNTFRSRAKVDILRIVHQMDNDELATGSTTNRIMPIMRTRKCAAADVSGGIAVKARPAWDTAINSPDDGVKILFNPGAYGGPDTLITAANRSAPFWQQFTMRQASAVEQVLSQDNSCAPRLALSSPFVLMPGEALIIEQQEPLLPVGGTSWFQIAWEEDQIDAGYVVGGTVNLSGSPVNGAKVLVVTDSATAMPAPEIETLTTGAPGTFSKTLASNVKAAVFVQHETGGTKYSDEGKPYIEAP